MPVITISRQLGTHGEEIAAWVAQTLGLRLIDAETINQAAQKAGVPQMALRELEHEGERGLANQVLKALRTMPSTLSYTAPSTGEGRTLYPERSGLTMPFTGLFSPLAPPISASLDSYVHMVDLVIRGVAYEGNVLIVGRGGQAVLKKHPGALHIQIVAPMLHRTQVIMARHSLDQRAAQNRLRTSDRARFDYVRRYHDVDWLDPSQYHLVINTAWVSVASAVDLIVAAQKAVAQPSDRGTVQE
jgi:cytidylate kinase